MLLAWGVVVASHRIAQQRQLDQWRKRYGSVLCYALVTSIVESRGRYHIVKVHYGPELLKGVRFRAPSDRQVYWIMHGLDYTLAEPAQTLEASNVLQGHQLGDEVLWFVRCDRVPIQATYVQFGSQAFPVRAGSSGLGDFVEQMEGLAKSEAMDTMGALAILASDSKPFVAQWAQQYLQHMATRARRAARRTN
ncbi:MAG: hypothetical protein KDA57_21840 [Planctomycetales bacterium]|nr:hypothetical protein [Planctomycetales bacterium]